ncbi:hypothetical protein SmJEL517_g00249 [Synchytrium microbalum]|uniref:Long-chain-fatty-acid--CoA ligase n=1 Tax=Synchytrium microbalum TaxID=1806994 RepID=A0A507CIV8_9FUNG|nr:uncharacterized protein SmJEL517_g00249 [Synchytrium microbalum]TPX38176.1 hypothetical protein SmJEL517_g00249 [Synchytrium microbalum]
MVKPTGGMSILVGSKTTPLLECTIGEYFDWVADKHPDSIAFVSKHQQVKWTFAKFKTEVNAVARGLWRLGIRKGDRVGAFLPSLVEYLLLLYAAGKIGCILVTVNPAYRAGELLDALKLVGVRALIFVPSLRGSNYVDMLKSIIPELASSAPHNLFTQAIPELRSLIVIDNAPWSGSQPFDFASNPWAVNWKDVSVNNANAIEEAQWRQAARFLQCRDIVNVQFTSGTTGRPKGVGLSHRNLLNNGRLIGDKMKLTTRDSIVLPVPLYHCFGLVLGNLAAMTHGAGIILPSESFDALSVLKAIQSEKATGCHGVPTMFIDCLNHQQFSQFNLSSLRTGIMAGTSCPIETMKECMSKMHLREIVICYGMTETSPVSLGTATDDPLVKRIETVGRIYDHTEIKLINPETNEIVPVGQDGEVCTRGYLIMEGGYFGNEAATRDAIDADGWMHTGDVGVMDSEGYVKISGRIKDLILRGGENISPLDVENCILGMHQVLNCSVVAVPDPRFGEAVCAVVILKENAKLTADDIRAYCRQHISPHKIPAYILFEQTLPVTVTGKIQKNVLRVDAAQKLGLVKAESKL